MLERNLFMDEMHKATTQGLERLFRKYYFHCTAANEDSLFDLITSIHSVNDKIKKSHCVDFFSHNGFIVVKALRNLFHHSTELINKMVVLNRTENVAFASDLMHLCLVNRNIVDAAVAALPSKFQETEREIVNEELLWYGEIADINPLIFNVMVYIFEMARSEQIVLNGSEYVIFAESYDLEESQGYSHYIDGKIASHAGDASKIIALIQDAYNAALLSNR